MSDTPEQPNQLTSNQESPGDGTRRTFLRRALAGGVAIVGAPYIVTRRSYAAGSLRTIHFSEAVHNLGYIDLYVARAKGFFQEQGIDLQLSAAGGDTQAFASVLGKSAEFGCGDATLCEISLEKGGPGVVLGELVSRAHYFGVSKKLTKMITDPKHFKGLTFVTSPPPNTNYNVLVLALKSAGLDPDKDVKILTVNPGTEIGPVLAGQADIAVAYEPNVDTAVVGQGAHVVFSWSKFMGPFHNTGMYALPEFVHANRHIVQGMANALQKGALHTYKYPHETKAVARKEFPDLDPKIVDAAIQRQLDNGVPARTFVVSKKGWENLMRVGAGLGNCSCDLPFHKVVDNSFAEHAAAHVKL
ncbi:MAG: ABC transporter substrate-binding protein [Candidatus Binataceae bacterium]|nr:ABC transporter substrate-binding protein [Candidatus Binataceae bacterium]